MATLAKFARLAHYSCKFGKASHIFLRNGLWWMSASLASPRKVFGECRRVSREREFASTRHSAHTKVCCFMHKKTYFISPDSTNSPNSYNTRQTRLSRVWRVLAKQFGECRRVWRVLAKCLANVGESGESRIFLKTAVLQVLRASCHCLLWIQTWGWIWTRVLKVSESD